ncbi:HYD1 signature containing ADP-ribosyltransferase family protein [Streptomyces clavifer]|uniref:HYD1 signature containing ADP-ribosyltransferase family protein n=1 Tax=Streptomyces clavifer TaxID=68188 RepID=UPI0037B7815A
MLYDLSGSIINATDGPLTLFHYTTEDGQRGILESNFLQASLRSKNPKDARYGDGQYLTDIPPGSRKGSSLSQALVRIPYCAHKFTHYVEIDITGLAITLGRINVYVALGTDPLSLDGRIKDWGVS